MFLFVNEFNVLFIYLFLNSLLLIKCLTIPSLPFDHLKYWLKNNKNEYKLLIKFCDNQDFEQILFEKLETDDNTNDLNFKRQICSELKNNENKCWGYESDCIQSQMYSSPECPEDSNGWARNRLEAMKVFFDSADFGYIGQRKQELKHFCKPKTETNDKQLVSSLECIQYMRYCSAKNIWFDFELLSKMDEPVRYREDVIGAKHIGGWNCDLKQKELKSEGQHKSPLQSWFAEIENFRVLSEDQNCDIVIEKPSFVMKLDATVNMYHHFCDFINLYASLHLNNSFSLDNNIVIWDSYPYRSNFGIVWNAFTRNPLLNIGQFKGKKVCFKDLILPLLPRMIYGIYYNMPLIPGCHKSGLFHAFNRHLIHRLNITTVVPKDNNLVRITLISRKTKYRQILNELELINGLKSNIKDISVEIHDFNHWTPFVDQIKVTANTDVLIGMHGAGLTHVLFQPDWGVLFELYNCDDEHCYKDLSRLRGVHYMTWNDSSKIFPEKTDYKAENPKFSADQKFTNYRFDTKEFVRLVRIAVNYVRNERNKVKEETNERTNGLNVKIEL